MATTVFEKPLNHDLSEKQNIIDNTLDTTAKNIPGAINELKTEIDAASGMIPTVIDGLTSTSATDALSAKQGKVLNDGKANANGSNASGTWEISITGNAATVNGKTVETNVPANAVFTDTWRPVVNDLTSTSATDALSANQGKVLNDKIPAVVNNLTSASTTDALSAFQGRVLNDQFVNHWGKAYGNSQDPIANLADLPVNGGGTVTMAASLSPTGSASMFSFEKLGNANRYTVKLTRIGNNSTYESYIGETYDGTFLGWIRTPNGIVDDLTSTSTTDSLSANQGKALNEAKVNGKQATWLPSNGYDPLASETGYFCYGTNPNLIPAQGLPTEVSSYGTVFGDCSGSYKSMFYLSVLGDLYLLKTNGTPEWYGLALKSEVPAVIDNLTSTDTDKSLSAKQGKALNDNKVSKTALIESGTDLNTIVTSGFYRLQTNMTNAPAVYAWSQMIVCRGNDTIAQIVCEQNANRMFVRTGSGIGGTQSWSQWKEVATDVYDGLDSTSTTRPLSAKQGKVLNNKIGGIEIAENTNLNTLTTPGNYYSPYASRSSTLINPPVTASGFALDVKAQGGNVDQIAYAGTSENVAIYIRSTIGADTSSWSSWRRLPSGIANGLKSTSTIDALSAAQGKVLNDKLAEIVQYQVLGEFGSQSTLDSALTTFNSSIGTHTKALARFTTSAAFGPFTANTGYFMELSKGASNTYSSATITAVGGNITIRACKASDGWHYSTITDTVLTGTGILPNNTNLNDIRTPGMYGLSGSNTYVNKPHTDLFALVVFRASETTVVVSQLAIGTRKLYIRMSSSATAWNDWHSIDGYGKEWLASTDLNNITIPGTYGLDASKTYTNAPVSNVTGIMEVIAPAASETYVIQRITNITTMYVRYRSASNGTAWGSWYKYTGTAV